MRHRFVPRCPLFLPALFSDGAVIEVSGEWRLQTKESADWQAAFNQAQAQELSDANASGPHAWRLHRTRD